MELIHVMLMSFDIEHKLIIDSFVYGIGRGTGNFYTELFIDFLDERFISGRRLLLENDALLSGKRRKYGKKICDVRLHIRRRRVADIYIQ